MSLKERSDLLELYRRGDAGVLFTLVEVRGSSYRRAGARLLASGAGGHAGTLSGGCLEADLLRRSAWYVRDGACVHTFSTAFDDTAEIPYGLGCGGEVEVLAEISKGDEADALLDALHATLQGERRTVVTVLPHAAQPLFRFVMDSRGDVLFASVALETEDLVPLRRIALRSIHGQTHAVTQGRMFVEILEPVQRLVIFGGGDDAKPVAALARTMGWRVAVVETRQHRITEERFPFAERIVASDASAVATGDAVLVMTHSYEQDRRIIADLLARPLASFIGLLGARHRSALLLQEAASLAGVPLAAAVAAVHAPVGLELGGEGPEAIALATVAQMQAHLHKGAPVTERRMSLHDVNTALANGPVQIPKSACAVSADATAVAL